VKERIKVRREEKSRTKEEEGYRLHTKEEVYWGCS